MCWLNKSLYELKQAPRAWHSRFASHITSHGFVEAKVDTSLFIYRRGVDTAFFFLYVDDIVLTALSQSFLRQIIVALQWELSMTDMGSFHYFLGISIERRANGLFLSPKQYIMDILDRVGIYDYKPCSTLDTH